MKKKILSLMLVGAMSLLNMGSVLADEYSEDYSKIFPNGKFETNSVPVKSNADLDVYVYAKVYNELFPKYKMDSYGILIENCNSSYTTCDVELQKTENNKIVLKETHKVEFIYNYEQKISDEMNKYLEIAKSGTGQGKHKEYLLEDTDLINYYASLNNSEEISDMNNAINYITDLRKEFNNTNITYKMDLRAGDIMPFINNAFGYFVVYSNNVLYGYVDGIGVNRKNILYVPSDTENTREAYVSAAKTRLTKILGYEPKVEVAKKRSEYDNSLFGSNEVANIDWSALGDQSLMGDYYYYIEINNQKYEFLIMRDSSKVKDFEYISKDINTNISVSASSMLPLDTIVNSKAILDNSEYKLKLNKENVYTFDITLYSKSQNKNINKLNNGKFLVGIPIPEALLNKNLVVEYIKEDGTIESHEVKVENNIAYFETDHFSVYSLSEVANKTVISTVENPATGDNLIKFVVLGGIAIVGVIGLIVYLKKTNKK